MKKKILVIIVMTLLITISSFQVMGVKSFIENTLEANNFQWEKRGTLSDYDDIRDIHDADLKRFISSNIGNDYQNMILAFTQCYGGNFIDDFTGYPRTTILTGNTPDLPTTYGKYHRGLANNLQPGRTTQDAHNDAQLPPYYDSSETPQHVGPSTMIGGDNDTFILVWASNPDILDYDDLKDIINNFPDANITAYFYNGGDPLIDGAATWTNMRDYFVNLGGIIRKNDQFILFVTDHGGLKYAFPIVLEPGLWEEFLPINPLILDLIKEEEEYIPYLKIFTPGEYATYYLEFSAYINDYPLNEFERYENDYNGNQIIEEDEGIEYIAKIDIDYFDENGNNTIMIYSYNNFSVNATVGIGTSLIRRRTPPDPPIIDGPSSGIPGTNYEFSFVTTTPNSYDLSYYIDWDDGDITDWTAYLPSGFPYYEYHMWDSKGTYIIKAKAKDIYGTESDWGTQTVTMPRNRAVSSPFLNFLQTHPNMFPLLQRLIHMLGPE